jgi:Do/DeqQ family serine protease
MMKKIASLLVVSILGGIITLGTYLAFFNEEHKQIIEIKQKEEPTIVQTSTAVGDTFEPESKLDFTKAAKESVDAVVHVKNTSVKTVRDPYAELYYGRGYGAKKYAQVGTGSGVIISSDGYIITNNHVIKGATEIEITLNNKKVYKAKLIGKDAKNDIALVKIEATDLPFMTFANSDNIKVGEWVLAIGNPYNLTSTVTAGIVSAKGRDLEGNENMESFIQTDAAVNPGNSGGALVNTRGELIGINTAISSKTGSFIGYSFAVPSNIAKKVIDDLLEYGAVQQVVLGVEGGELNGTIANKYELKISEGFYVNRVTKNSGAEIAGIKKGDIITKIDNIKISTYADLAGFLRSKEPNEMVKVTVVREDTEIQFDVRLDKKELIKSQLGFRLKDLSVQELEDYQIQNGVKITDIENEYLIKYGVKDGYIITSVNGVVVNTADDVEKVISHYLGKYPVRLEMINLKGEQERYIFR